MNPPKVSEAEVSPQPSKQQLDGDDSGTLVMKVSGLYLEKTDENGKRHSKRVSDKFKVTGNLSDAGGRSYAVALTWKDDRGRAHQRVIPLRLFTGTSREICAPLLDEGMRIEPKMQVRFLEYIWNALKAAPKADLATRTGWYDGNRFVFPNEVIADGAGGSILMYDAPTESAHYFRTAGTHDEWIENVGKLCVGNSRLVLAVSLAFAAPLLRPLIAESIGVHLRGTSSKGKTTAQHVAGSVCGGGGGNGYLHSWRSTPNGLEGIASTHNDLMLCLDEISQIDQNAAIEAIYLLMNGSGKNRANVDGSARRGSAWKLTLLSSGELSLAEHSEKRTKGGAEIRFIDIEADAGTGFGLFEDTHRTKDNPGDPPGKAFSNRLRLAAQQYYGHGIREFVRLLCAIETEEQREIIREMQQDFMNLCPIAGATPEVGRVAQAMALIAAAGELASLWQLTGWPLGEANRAVKKCFDGWIASRGGTKTAHDEQQGIAAVRRCIEQSGNSRFETIHSGMCSTSSDVETTSEETASDDRLVHNRLGFKRKVDGRELEFLFLPEMFKSEVCVGFDSRMVLKALAKRGLLRREEPALTLSARLPGLGKTRVYCVSSEIVKTMGE